MDGQCRRWPSLSARNFVCTDLRSPSTRWNFEWINWNSIEISGTLMRFARTTSPSRACHCIMTRHQMDGKGNERSSPWRCGLRWCHWTGNGNDFAHYFFFFSFFLFFRWKRIFKNKIKDKICFICNCFISFWIWFHLGRADVVVCTAILWFRLACLPN